MARQQNNKRQPADELPQDDNRPAKSAKSTGNRNFAPSFWDNLSKVWLTPRALRELDRRNKRRRVPTRSVSEDCLTDLARFARGGGPDLCHLRGTQGLGQTKTAPQGRALSAYDSNFEQHLLDYNIYPPRRDLVGGPPRREPANLEGIRRMLSTVSQSLFTELDFWEFMRQNKTRSKSRIMDRVVPIIIGDTDIPNKGDLQFTNLKSLTDRTAITAAPDYFQGSRRGDINKKVRDDLNNVIVPLARANVPVLPNFFLEAGTPEDDVHLPSPQACYDGALGARAMHALQNYGEPKPIYDGNAYTYSSVYYSTTGTLLLFAHHITAPAAARGRPEYHMTKVESYILTEDREAFVRGVAALRNIMKLAKLHRDYFAQVANRRVSRKGSNTSAPVEYIVV